MIPATPWQISRLFDLAAAMIARLGRLIFARCAMQNKKLSDPGARRGRRTGIAAAVEFLRPPLAQKKDRGPGRS
jgi:hypothetical protein